MHDWRIGSLFSGIGGLELGLERAGLGRTTVQVESDAFARRVLARHWPGAERYEDVRGVGAAELGGVEVLCGGFPCQDISQAGRGAGIGGQRSGLWAEYARIIGEVRPRVVVVENVAMLLRRGMGRVLGDLAALGYDAEWDCVPAAAVGAPHRRDRVFLVAHPRGGGCVDGCPSVFPAEPRFPALGEPVAGGPLLAYAGRERLEGGQVARERTRRGHGPEPDGEAVPNGHGGRQPGPGRRRTRGERWVGGVPRWAAEPDVGRVADGVPGRVDRLRCLGNAVVPQVAEYVGGLIVTAFGLQAQPDLDDGKPQVGRPASGGRARGVGGDR